MGEQRYREFFCVAIYRLEECGRTPLNRGAAQGNALKMLRAVCLPEGGGDRHKSPICSACLGSENDGTAKTTNAAIMTRKWRKTLRPKEWPGPELSKSAPQNVHLQRFEAKKRDRSRCRDPVFVAQIQIGAPKMFFMSAAAIWEMVKRIAIDAVCLSVLPPEFQKFSACPSYYLSVLRHTNSFRCRVRKQVRSGLE